MIERDPGLRLNIPQKYLRTVPSGQPLQSGVEVEIVGGPYKGFRGHVHFTGYFDDARVRTGDPKEWEAYDAELYAEAKKRGLI